MKSIKFTIINEETGEIVELKDIISCQNNVKITKRMVDIMLSQSKNLEDIDKEMLYSWCKVTKQINNYGQVKLLGIQRQIELEKKMLEEGIIYVYVAKILYSAHPFSCAIMKNRKTKISSWTELWELINCKSRETQRKVKLFLINNNLVREVIINEGSSIKYRHFYLNPFLLRTSSYASQIAINCFQDCAKDGINMSTYAYRFLQCVGVIDNY